MGATTGDGITRLCRRLADRSIPFTYGGFCDLRDFGAGRRGDVGAGVEQVTLTKGLSLA